MPYSTKGANNMLDGIGITHVGALVGFPTDSGAGSNEVSGGSYARQAITYAAASGKQKAKSGAAVSIPIPAGTTVYFIGGWDASSAGNILKWSPVNGGSVKGVGTAATDDTITSNAHGLSDGDRVFVEAVNGESLPSGLSAATWYFVISSTTNTFKLSTSVGGSAVDITAVGELAFQKVIPETFGSAGTLDVSSDTLDLLG